MPRSKQIKDKVVCFIIAVICFITVSTCYVHKHTWRAISQDGYVDKDRGMGVSMTSWKSVNGEAIVRETLQTYSTSEAARKAFQEVLEDSRTIFESTMAIDNLPGENERVVKAAGSAETGEGAVEIIKLKDKTILYINAGSVTYASAFENITTSSSNTLLERRRPIWHLRAYLISC
jgi:hypothetical protein